MPGSNSKPRLSIPDNSLAGAGCHTFKKSKPGPEIGFLKKLSSRTHFSYAECQSLLSMHRKITENRPLDQVQFREVIHACFDLFEEIIHDRVFRAFDKNNDGVVDGIEWVEGCSTLIRGTPDELIDFTFFVFNINGDGCIDREEVYQFLRKCLFPVPQVLEPEELEDGVRDIIEVTMRKLDKNHDGQITYQEYEEACRREPLLIQALGSCIPPTKAMAAFLATFSEDYRHYTAYWWKTELNFDFRPVRKVDSSRQKQWQVQGRYMDGSDPRVGHSNPVRIGGSISKKKNLWKSEKMIESFFSAAKHAKDVQQQNPKHSIKNDNKH